MIISAILICLLGVPVTLLTWAVFYIIVKEIINEFKQVNK